MQHLGKVPVAIDTSVQEAHARKIILVTKSHRDKCKERRRGRGNYPELKWSLGRGARWGGGIMKSSGSSSWRDGLCETTGFFLLLGQNIVCLFVSDFIMSFSKLL